VVRRPSPPTCHPKTHRGCAFRESDPRHPAPPGGDRDLPGPGEAGLPGSDEDQHHPVKPTTAVPPPRRESGARGVPDLRRGSYFIVAALVLVATPWSSVRAEGEVIEKIVVDGNVRISAAAVMTQLSIKEGDPYDEDALRREFERLWELNLFDNITLEVRQGEK